MLILKPSKKKIFLNSFIFLSFATICFFIEIITNKITQGTQLIWIYESIFFYLLASYYLVQLIPGYAKFIIDEKGFSEIWFFRQRINVSWTSIDINQSKQTRAGDTLYINSEKEQLFSRKMVCKGAYSLSDKLLYPKIIEQLSHFSKTTKTNGNHYLVLGQMKAILLLALTIIIIAFNSYYLSSEKTDVDFIEQVKYWQQQGNTDKKLFESFKVYGFYWKNQLKQFDRNLFHRILLQESQQIESAMLKRREQMSAAQKIHFKQQLQYCKDNYLYYDENSYLQCLDKI
ncbi:MAG: hypothetical protein QM504_04220 [Pseudomonadota bacterium]